MIRLTIPGQPQGKARARVCVRGGFARAYTPDKTAAYENLIKLCYPKEASSYINATIKMTILAFYSIPKSFSKVKINAALNGSLRPQTKPDIDNIAKVICDALNGVAYKDDSQIVQLYASKFYANEPRVEVVIKEVKEESE